MAEQTEITNVGGEGVASEVTLANLLSVTEQMAKKAGVDPKDVTKKLTALSKATQDTVNISTKNRDALGKHTKEVKKSAGAISKLGSMAGNMLFRSFGALARSGTEITKAFLSGETSMTAFASQLPLVGNQLSILTGIFDNTFTAFQNVAGSGAAFNNSLVELRNSAAGARMPLDQFASMIGANSDKLAAFGGTATEGAKRVVALNKALGSNRNDLLNMGLGYQEINEALIDYQYLQRAGNRGLRLSQAQQIQQAEAAADYTKNLVTLGKLTGDDVKTQQAKLAQAQMDVAMQAKLATMSREERAKMDSLMADTLASGGQQAVDALKREFLGMPPMTEEAALYTTQFGENINSIAGRLEQVYDANVTAADMASSSTDYMANMIEGNAAAFARLQPGLTAAAAGLDGPMATIAQQLMDAGIQFTDFIDQDTGEVDRARLEAAIEQAKAESDARGPATEAMVSFQETLTALQEQFTTSITTPLMTAVGPAFEAIATALGEGDGFKGVMKTVSDYIKDDLTPGILEFIKAFKDDPKKAMQDLFANIKDAIADILLGPNTKEIMTPGGPEEVEVEREGGLLSSLGEILVDAMKSGIAYLWEETSIIETMVGGIAALWAGKALATAMLTGVGRLMSAGVTRMTRGPATPGATPRTPAATPGATPKTPAATPGAAPRAVPGAATAGNSLGKTAATIGRGASRLLGPLAALLSVAEIASVAMNDDLSSDEKTVGVSEAAGGGGGALAGAAAGAAIGSVVPIIGTAIGGALGGALGYFGGRWLGGKAGEAMVGDEGEGEGTPTPTPEATATPAIEQPGAQLAMLMTPEQVTAMERIAAVNLSTFNTGLNELMQIDLRSFYRFVEIDWESAASGISALASTDTLSLAHLSQLDLSTFATSIDTLADVNTRSLMRFASIDIQRVADGFKTFGDIPDLKTNFDTINSLDAAPVRTYTEAIEGLVEALDKLNDELSQDNDTMFTSRADAGELLSGISASTSGTSQGTETLNNTMQQVMLLLREMRDLDVKVESNTRNIVGSNLAQGNVSNVGR